MKKHDEGYALVLVLVVITVLCLVAMAMMAASLKNLTNQQSSIERMQAKYQAQGEIEKVIAALENIEGAATLDSIWVGDVERTVLSCEGKVCLVSFSASCDSVKITCQIEITSQKNIISQVETGTYVYNLEDPTYKYISYLVDVAGGESNDG